MSGNEVGLVGSAVTGKDIKGDIGVVEVEVWVEDTSGLGSSNGAVVEDLGHAHDESIVRSKVPLHSPVH